MSDPRTEEPRRRSLVAKWMFVVWTVSSLVFLALVVELGTRFRPVVETLEVELPGLTLVLLELSSFLHRDEGMIIALVAQGMSLLPFAIGGLRNLQPKLYVTLAIVGLLALVVVWIGLVRPIDTVAALLESG